MFRAVFALIAILSLNLYAATEIVKIIRADGTGDYTSLAAWESAENRDLVAADQIAVARIEGSWSSPGSNVLIAGWTTDATHYIKIYTAPDARHKGVWDDTKFRLQGNGNVINVQVPYTRLEGLQVTAGLVDDVLQHGIDANAGGQTGLWVSHCIVRLSSAVVNYSYAQGITLAEGGAGGARIFNNIVYGFKTTNQTSNYGIFVSLVDNPALLYNNTAVGCNVGFGGVWGRTITPKNNIAQGCDVSYFDIAGGTNNISDRFDAPGANPKQQTTVTFVDAANKNFHLATNDIGARDAGADLSADPGLSFTTDIDGDTRSGSWDIGADEAGGSVTDITPPTVSGVSISGAPSVVFGSSQRITWTASDNIGVVRCSLWVSYNGGSTYTFMAETTAAGIVSGSKTWTVPNTPTSNAVIRVAAYDAAGKSGSAVSAAFAIVNGTLPTSVILQEPNGTETWPAASTQNIRWSVSGNQTIASCSLFYSLDNGATWNLIGGTAGNPTVYAWQVPSVSSAVCAVKVIVRDAAGVSAFDVSDNPFSIVRTPYITSPDSVIVEPGGRLNYMILHDAGGQSGTPSFQFSPGFVQPYPMGIIGNVVKANPVPTEPAPRVDTIRVRFTLGSFVQDFKLRVMVRAPLAVGAHPAAAQVLKLEAETGQNEIRFRIHLDRNGPCEFSVYDISGRRIWRTTRTTQAGETILSWKPLGSKNSIHIAELKSEGRTLRRIFGTVR